MNDALQARQLLNDTINYKLTHTDYERVTDLAQEYFDIFTATGIESYLKQYRHNDSDEVFKLVLNIYQSTIPATVHNLDTLFEKPLRSNRIYSAVDNANGAARDEILSKMQSFWQGETESGVDAYLKERWKRLCLYDPNAFIALEFSDFNPLKEKPQPFAVEWSSEQAINYSYNVSGLLDWLICRKVIHYEGFENNTPIIKEGFKYVMYLDNQALVYTEVDNTTTATDIPGAELVLIFYPDNLTKKPDKVFIAQLFDTKSLVLPAFRVGYLLDAQTEGRSCISNIHYALPFLKKELKSGAELDITLRAHAFPQKYMYGNKCQGDKERDIPPCINGRARNGGTCEACGGTGSELPVHQTGGDVVIIPIPKDSGAPVIDLTKAMAYFSPPVELLKFQEEYCDRLTEKAKAAVFPSQSIAVSRNTLSASPSAPTTATEQDYSWDNVYDTYRPFTARYSYAWRFIVRLIAIYTDNYTDSLRIYHSFPSDYKLKTLGDLLNEAKAANDSGLPQYAIQAIYNDILEVQYADDQDSLLKLRIKAKFQPFAGKTATEIQFLLTQGKVSAYYEALYVYFGDIFLSIDNELGDAFYLLSYDNQKAEIDNRVQVYLDEAAKVKAQALSTFLKNSPQPQTKPQPLPQPATP